MTVEQLVRKIMKEESVDLIDVRSKANYDDWKVEGKSVNVVNAPYEEIHDVHALKEKLPDGEFVIVCNQDPTARKVAALLEEAGMDGFYYLEGGMRAFGEHIEPVFVSELPDGGELYQFVRLGKGCLSYAVMSEGQAAIVDPSRTIQPYLDFVEDKGLTLTHVIDTHLHADHISGGLKLAEEVEADYWLSSKDGATAEYDFRPLEDVQEIQVGLSVITLVPSQTPGHTKGSITLLVANEFLLTGDTLFVQSVGRPDLAGKAEQWVDDLYETLFERYKSYAPSVVVLPGHFASMDEWNQHGYIGETLGHLYKHNRGLEASGRSEFVEMVLSHLSTQPNDYEDIRQVNLGKLQPSEDEQRSMEVGPNRCAVHEGKG